MTKSKMMKKAHKIAKTLEGNYGARLSMALKMVWVEVKEMLSRLIKIEVPTNEGAEWRVDSNDICTEDDYEGVMEFIENYL